MIYFLPGMGATSEMYPEPWHSLPGSVFLDWPEKFTGTSITDLAEQLIEEHQITSKDTVIGTSLGGIVACEIANLIGLRQLVLISSAIHPSEVSPVLRVLHPLIKIFPLTLARWVCKRIPHILPRMFAASDPAFIRRMCFAIFSWSGHQSPTPVFRIHGRRDFIIPPPSQTDTLLSSGHLLPMSYPEACIENLPPDIRNTHSASPPISDAPETR